METNKQVSFLAIFTIALSLLGFTGCVKQNKSKDNLIQDKTKKANILDDQAVLRRDINMTPDELAEKYQTRPKALKNSLEKLVKKSPNDVDLKFKFADACKNIGDYQKASDVYKLCSILAFNKSGETDMLSEHDLSAKREYAKFSEIFCRNKIVGFINDDCDLTPLNDVISLCDTFFKEFPNSQDTKDVVDIKLGCRSRLLYKMQHIFDYYLDNWLSKEGSNGEKVFAQGDKMAAEKILEKMQRDFNVEDLDVAPRIAFSKFKLAKIEYQVSALKKADALHKKNSLLAKKYGFSAPDDVKEAKAAQYHDLLSYLDEEQKARNCLLTRLDVLNQKFADSKEAKSAQAIAVSVLA